MADSQPDTGAQDQTQTMGVDSNVQGAILGGALATGTYQMHRMRKAGKKTVASVDSDGRMINKIPKGAPEKQAAVLNELAKKNQPLVMEALQEFDEQNGTSSRVEIKKPERILQKAMAPDRLAEKPWYTVAHTPDSLQFLTVINNEDEALKAVQSFTEKTGAEIVNVDDYVSKPRPSGFRALKVDLRMPDGHLVEYQIRTKKVDAYAESEHAVGFENWRNTSEEERVKKAGAYRDYLDKHRNGYYKAYQADVAELGFSSPELFESSWAKTIASLASSPDNLSKSSSRTSGSIDPMRELPLGSVTTDNPSPKTNNRPLDLDLKTETSGSSLAFSGNNSIIDIKDSPGKNITENGGGGNEAISTSDSATGAGELKVGRLPGGPVGRPTLGPEVGFGGGVVQDSSKGSGIFGRFSVGSSNPVRDRLTQAMIKNGVPITEERIKELMATANNSKGKYYDDKLNDLKVNKITGEMDFLPRVYDSDGRIVELDRALAGTKPQVVFKYNRAMQNLLILKDSGLVDNIPAEIGNSTNDSFAKFTTEKSNFKIAGADTAGRTIIRGDLEDIRAKAFGPSVESQQTEALRTIHETTSNPGKLFPELEKPALGAGSIEPRFGIAARPEPETGFGGGLGWTKSAPDRPSGKIPIPGLEKAQEKFRQSQQLEEFKNRLSNRLDKQDGGFNDTKPAEIRDPGTSFNKGSKVEVVDSAGNSNVGWEISKVNDDGTFEISKVAKSGQLARRVVNAGELKLATGAGELKVGGANSLRGRPVPEPGFGGGSSLAADKIGKTTYFPNPKYVSKVYAQTPGMYGIYPSQPDSTTGVKIDEPKVKVTGVTKKSSRTATRDTDSAASRNGNSPATESLTNAGEDSLDVSVKSKTTATKSRIVISYDDLADEAVKDAKTGIWEGKPLMAGTDGHMHLVVPNEPHVFKPPVLSIIDDSGKLTELTESNTLIAHGSRNGSGEWVLSDGSTKVSDVVENWNLEHPSEPIRAVLVCNPEGIPEVVEIDGVIHAVGSDVHIQSLDINGNLLARVDPEGVWLGTASSPASASNQELMSESLRSKLGLDKKTVKTFIRDKFIIKDPVGIALADAQQRVIEQTKGLKSKSAAKPTGWREKTKQAVDKTNQDLQAAASEAKKTYLAESGEGRVNAVKKATTTGVDAFYGQSPADGPTKFEVAKDDFKAGVKRIGRTISKANNGMGTQSEPVPSSEPAIEPKPTEPVATRPRTPVVEQPTANGHPSAGPASEPTIREPVSRPASVSSRPATEPRVATPRAVPEPVTGEPASEPRTISKPGTPEPGISNSTPKASTPKSAAPPEDWGFGEWEETPRTKDLVVRGNRLPAANGGVKTPLVGKPKIISSVAAADAEKTGSKLAGEVVGSVVKGAVKGAAGLARVAGGPVGVAVGYFALPDELSGMAQEKDVSFNSGGKPVAQKVEVSKQAVNIGGVWSNPTTRQPLSAEEQKSAEANWVHSHWGVGYTSSEFNKAPSEHSVTTYNTNVTVPLPAGKNQVVATDTQGGLVFKGPNGTLEVATSGGPTTKLAPKGTSATGAPLYADQTGNEFSIRPDGVLAKDDAPRSLPSTARRVGAVPGADGRMYPLYETPSGAHYRTNSTGSQVYQTYAPGKPVAPPRTVPTGSVAVGTMQGKDGKSYKVVQAPDGTRYRTNAAGTQVFQTLGPAPITRTPTTVTRTTNVTAVNRNGIWVGSDGTKLSPAEQAKAAATAKASSGPNTGSVTTITRTTMAGGVSTATAGRSAGAVTVSYTKPHPVTGDKLAVEVHYSDGSVALTGAHGSTRYRWLVPPPARSVGGATVSGAHTQTVSTQVVWNGHAWVDARTRQALPPSEQAAAQSAWDKSHPTSGVHVSITRTEKVTVGVGGAAHTTVVGSSATSLGSSSSSTSSSPVHTQPKASVVKIATDKDGSQIKVLSNGIQIRTDKQTGAITEKAQGGNWYTVKAGTPAAQTSSAPRYTYEDRPTGWTTHTSSQLTGQKKGQTVSIGGVTHNNVTVDVFSDGKVTYHDPAGKVIGYGQNTPASAAPASAFHAPTGVLGTAAQTAATKAGLDPNNVQEVKQGADGRIILHMRNGNFVTIDPKTGDHNLAGSSPKFSNPPPRTSSSSAPPTHLDPSQPAWHQNPDWRPPTDSDMALIKNRPNFDASQVLEVRPANDGGLILRMSDGTYREVYTTSDATPEVGTWNKDQWNAAPQKPDDTDTSDSSSQSGGSGNSSGSSRNDSSLDPAIRAAMGWQSSSTNGPEWHTNPNWVAPSSELLNKIHTQNPNIESYGTVLESRPATDGSSAVILRLSDGSYMRYDPTTGATTGAGNWNKDQWPTGQTQSDQTEPKSPEPAPEVSPHVDTIVAEHSDSTPVSNANLVSQLKAMGILDTGNQSRATSSSKVNGLTGGLSVPGSAISALNTDSADAGLKKPTHHISSGLLHGGVTDPVKVTQELGTTHSDPPAEHIGLSADPTPNMSGDPTGSCFVAGSRVLIPNGYKAIELIKIGDSVQTWHVDNKLIETTRVTAVMKHQDKETIVVETEDGARLTTTPEHPFWTGEKWLAAGKLMAGKSTVFNQHSEQRKVVKIVTGPKADVYNFHVTSPAHNYFVEGYLVHNMKIAGM